MRRSTSSRRRAISDSSVSGALSFVMWGIMSDSDIDHTAEWTRLLSGMGYALQLWSHVEESLFLLFSELLRSPCTDVDSVVFYSSPSFESKRVLTDRVAQLVLDANSKATWAELCKRLEVEGGFRGKIAHYSLDFDVFNFEEMIQAMSDGIETPKPIIGPPYLRSPKHNKISLTKKSNQDSSALRTESKEIMEHCNKFMSLSRDIDKFRIFLGSKEFRSTGSLADSLLRKRPRRAKIEE